MRACCLDLSIGSYDIIGMVRWMPDDDQNQVAQVDVDSLVRMGSLVRYYAIDPCRMFS